MSTFKIRYLFTPSLIALLGGIYALFMAKEPIMFKTLVPLGFIGFVGCAVSISESNRRWSLKRREEMGREKDQPKETIEAIAKPSLWLRFWLSRPVMVILIALFVVVIFLRLQQADWQIQLLP